MWMPESEEDISELKTKVKIRRDSLRKEGKPSKLPKLLDEEAQNLEYRDWKELVRTFRGGNKRPKRHFEKR